MHVGVASHFGQRGQLFVLFKLMQMTFGHCDRIHRANGGFCTSQNPIAAAADVAERGNVIGILLDSLPLMATIASHISRCWMFICARFPNDRSIFHGVVSVVDVFVCGAVRRSSVCCCLSPISPSSLLFPYFIYSYSYGISPDQRHARCAQSFFFSFSFGVHSNESAAPAEKCRGQDETALFHVFFCIAC